MKREGWSATRYLLVVVAFLAIPHYAPAAADVSAPSSAHIEWIEYATEEVFTRICIEPVDLDAPWGVAIFTYEVENGESGRKLVPITSSSTLYSGGVYSQTEFKSEGKLLDFDVDHEFSIGPRSMVVRSCYLQWQWTDEVMARSTVVVYAVHNAVETSFERTLTPASSIETLWAADTSKVSALEVGHFEDAPFRMSVRSNWVDNRGQEFVVGGRQEVEISEGFYGHFSHFDVQGGGHYGVTRPDGSDVSDCVVRSLPCEGLSGSRWSASLLAGGSGRYAFWNEVTKTNNHHVNLFAFWVDAPLPPGVTVPP